MIVRKKMHSCQEKKIAIFGQILSPSYILFYRHSFWLKACSGTLHLVCILKGKNHPLALSEYQCDAQPLPSTEVNVRGSEACV